MRPPIEAGFYRWIGYAIGIETSRFIFAGRDGVKKYPPFRNQLQTSEATPGYGYGGKTVASASSPQVADFSPMAV